MNENPSPGAAPENGGVSPYVFIVGSPRSGTTILGEVLGRHPDVAHWYEPYFIWDRRTGNMDDDVRDAAMVTGASRDYIRREFALYLRRSGAKRLVEKTPENCFKIPFINAVFPDAKWIHIYRDGRDAVLSMQREWVKRQAIVEQRRVFDFLAVFGEMMSLHPFWRNRFQALWFELSNMPGLDPRAFLNKSKWEGKAGWGPRFPGWKEALAGMSPLEFNATQWVRCIERAFADLAACVPEENRIEMRYETFIERGDEELERIFDFLGLERRAETGLGSDLNPANQGKWKTAFSDDEKTAIGPIVNDTLVRLNYAQDERWFTPQPASSAVDTGRNGG